MTKLCSDCKNYSYGFCTLLGGEVCYERDTNCGPTGKFWEAKEGTNGVK